MCRLTLQHGQQHSGTLQRRIPSRDSCSEHTVGLLLSARTWLAASCGPPGAVVSATVWRAVLRRRRAHGGARSVGYRRGAAGRLGVGSRRRLARRLQAASGAAPSFRLGQPQLHLLRLLEQRGRLQVKVRGQRPARRTRGRRKSGDQRLGCDLVGPGLAKAWCASVGGFCFRPTAMGRELPLPRASCSALQSTALQRRNDDHRADRRNAAETIGPR